YAQFEGYRPFLTKLAKLLFFHSLGEQLHPSYCNISQLFIFGYIPIPARLDPPYPLKTNILTDLQADSQ
ncbi:MAG: hypothetical protein Q8O16_00150, partial [Dehalococcoidia bacterium]|nr:hypothetical protein [Dehalococcoidia bacterium]